MQTDAIILIDVQNSKQSSKTNAHDGHSNWYIDDILSDND